MKVCQACGTAWNGPPGTQPGRSETCSRCGMDLHCCRNCQLYDASASNECRSRTTERVKDKEKRNFCDEFDCVAAGSSAPSSDKGDMDQKWNDLFK